MRIHVMSIFVTDQRKALAFYTDVLGFVTVADVPLGEYSWLTVASPEDPEGMQILLEPNQHPAVVPFTSAIVADGSWLTESRGRHLQSMTCSKSMTASSPEGLSSPSRRPPKGRSPQHCSTTPSATSSRWCRWRTLPQLDGLGPAGQLLGVQPLAPA